ncbi:MAG: hypothetical protein JNK05_13505 [Myxococcales bacterium]|nr:hypothetical protein [Myxococcales bacterium]
MIVEGEAAMPVTFVACLVQLDKIMDGHPDARLRDAAAAVGQRRAE